MSHHNIKAPFIANKPSELSTTNQNDGDKNSSQHNERRKSVLYKRMKAQNRPSIARSFSQEAKKKTRKKKLIACRAYPQEERTNKSIESRLVHFDRKHFNGHPKQRQGAQDISQEYSTIDKNSGHGTERKEILTRVKMNFRKEGDSDQSQNERSKRSSLPLGRSGSFDSGINKIYSKKVKDDNRKIAGRALTQRRAKALSSSSVRNVDIKHRASSASPTFLKRTVEKESYHTESPLTQRPSTQRRAKELLYSSDRKVPYSETVNKWKTSFASDHTEPSIDWCGGRSSAKDRNFRARRYNSKASFASSRGLKGTMEKESDHTEPSIDYSRVQSSANRRSSSVWVNKSKASFASPRGLKGIMEKESDHTNRSIDKGSDHKTRAVAPKHQNAMVHALEKIIGEKLNLRCLLLAAELESGGDLVCLPAILAIEKALQRLVRENEDDGLSVNARAGMATGKRVRRLLSRQSLQVLNKDQVIAIEEFVSAINEIQTSLEQLLISNTDDHDHQAKHCCMESIEIMEYFGDVVLIEDENDFDSMEILEENGYINCENEDDTITGPLVNNLQRSDRNNSININGRVTGNDSSKDGDDSDNPNKSNDSNDNNKKEDKSSPGGGGRGLFAYIPSSPRKACIIVKPPAGLDKYFRFPSCQINEKTKHLKRAIAEKTKKCYGITLKAKDQVLLFNNIVLDDEMLLIDRGVKPGDTLHLSYNDTEIELKSALYCLKDEKIKFWMPQDWGDSDNCSRTEEDVAWHEDEVQSDTSDEDDDNLCAINIQTNNCSDKIEINILQFDANQEILNKMLSDKILEIFIQKIKIKLVVEGEKKRWIYDGCNTKFKHEVITKQYNIKKQNNLNLSPSAMGFGGVSAGFSNEITEPVTEVIKVIEGKSWLDRVEAGVWILERKLWNSTKKNDWYEKIGNNQNKLREVKSCRNDPNLHLEGEEGPLLSMTFAPPSDGDIQKMLESMYCKIILTIELVKILEKKDTRLPIWNKCLKFSVQNIVARGAENISKLQKTNQGGVMNSLWNKIGWNKRE